MEMYLAQYDNGQSYDEHDSWIIGLFSKLDLAQSFSVSYMRKYSLEHFKHGNPTVSVYAMEVDSTTSKTVAYFEWKSKGEIVDWYQNR